MAGFSLGPFEMIEPIARGGMGEVWRARHHEQWIDVAIKVMTGSASQSQRYRQFFKNEVRAVAGLDHPGIIIVLDHGEVPEYASEVSDLVAGSPYLAMELASGGSLADMKTAPSWSELKNILIRLLDALAHAHARGVIHRDLKPGNVLMCTGGMLKISDFGIAMALSPDEGHETGMMSIIGTPHFMAPEQLTGEWRDFGPWTDLYALGCMAYRFACGQTPFEGHQGPALIRAHLMDEPAPIAPLRAVPDGFTEWVAQLLEKDHRDRFQRAADAAWALESLGGVDPSEDEPSDVMPELPTQEFTTFSLTADMEPTDEMMPIQVHYRATDMQWGRPPIPDTWKRRDPPAPPMNLLGAGLGLYGLRTLRVVGRRTERDAIWQSLIQVAGGKPRAVLVHGPAGVGKSRLVQWTCQRAHELGAAHVVSVVHSPSDGPGDALQRMVCRYLNCERIDRERVKGRVASFLGQDTGEDVERLTDFVCPRPSMDGAMRIEHADQRYATVARVLAHLTQDRPVLLWLEDVHWGVDSLGFVEYLIRNNDLPVLALMTVRDEIIAERPEEAARVRDLLSRRSVKRLSVGPLAPPERSRLCRELLGLEETLAAQVEERTGGNPLFMVHLVGDWVHRDLLESSSEGFRLRQGARVELPDDMHTVWSARVEQVIDGLPGHARSYLELAAILGSEVDEEEWQEACDLPYGGGIENTGEMAFSPKGMRTRMKLMDRLFELRLAHETEFGWAFSQGMFRESLERSAREGDRWAQHHEVCATVLQRRHADKAGSAERIGRHLVSAGQLDAALEYLLMGVRERKLVVGYREAISLLGVCEQVMKAMRLAITDRRWGRLYVQRAGLFRLSREEDDGAQWADHAIATARSQRWDDVLADGLVERSQIAQLSGELPLARHHLEEALEVADPVRRGRVLRNLASVSLSEGDTVRARELLEQASTLFGEQGNDFGQAEVYRVMANVADSPEVAHEYLDKALATYRNLGVRSGIAYCLNGLGDLARKRGDLDAAQSAYEESLELFNAIGGGQAVIPRMNLALVNLYREDWDDAKRHAIQALRDLERRRRSHILGAVHTLLMAATAGAGDWGLFDDHANDARSMLRRSGFKDADNAWAAKLAGDKAFGAREYERARIAWTLAMADFRGRGDTEGAAQVEQSIRALPTPDYLGS